MSASQSSLAVVIPTLNGATRLPALLGALRAQVRVPDEVVVVDDGSTDASVEVARRFGARVVEHGGNFGAAAARNSGLDATASDVVAFIDDDCVPSMVWTLELLTHYGPGVVGVGGTIVPVAENTFVQRYLRRHNPAEPLEIDLEASRRLVYRFWLYVRRGFIINHDLNPRLVFAFAGGNMSFLRDALLNVNGLDPALYYGGEDTDLCRRIVLNTQGQLIFAPAATINHRYNSDLRGLLRRSWFYGRASAWLFLRDPQQGPTFLPAPTVAVLAALILGSRHRLRKYVVFVPLALFPQSAVGAFRRREIDGLLDPYLQLLHEGANNIGFITALLTSRRRRRNEEK